MSSDGQTDRQKAKEPTVQYAQGGSIKMERGYNTSAEGKMRFRGSAHNKIRLDKKKMPEMALWILHTVLIMLFPQSSLVNVFQVFKIQNINSTQLESVFVFFL